MEDSNSKEPHEVDNVLAFLASYTDSTYRNMWGSRPSHFHSRLLDVAETLLLSLRQGPLPPEVRERVHQTIESLSHEIDWTAWGSRDDFESLSSNYDEHHALQDSLGKLCLLNAADLARGGDWEGLRTWFARTVGPGVLGNTRTLLSVLSYLDRSFLAQRILDPESMERLETIWRSS